MSRSRAALPVALAVCGSLAACSAFMPEIGGLRAGSADGGVPGNPDDGGSDAEIGPGDGGSDAMTDGALVDHVDASDAASSTFTVLVGPGDSHTFSPSTLTVRVGDTVHWVWSSGGHTVTSGSGASADGLFCSPSDGAACSGTPTSASGATYDHRFTSAGTFPYFCRPHVGSGMMGTVTVQ